MTMVTQLEVASIEDVIPISRFQISFNLTSETDYAQHQKDIRRLTICNTKVKRPTRNLQARYPEHIWGPLVLEFVEVASRLNENTLNNISDKIKCINLQTFSMTGELQETWEFIHPEIKTISYSDLDAAVEHTSKFIGVEKLIVEFSVRRIITTAP